jgi:uncharacterized protein YbjT (DUF2867 family)
MSKEVLITGAGGKTGNPAVREAIALGLKVRAMVRSKDARAETLEKLGAEVVVGDFFEINTLRDAMQGMEAAHLCYPTAPGLIHATVNFAQAAKETGVKTVLNMSQRSANRESKNPENHIGTIIPLSGPVEMDHEQMAAELSEALGRKIVFQNVSIDEYSESAEKLGIPPYGINFFRHALVDYRNGRMSGADNNIEKLTGRRAMTVGEFARAHADELNGK